MAKSTNLTWHDATIPHDEREALTGQRGCVLWFTGLSGSGKSTVSRRVEELLLRRGAVCYALDGDNVRMGLCEDLGFAAADRTENIRRIGEVAKLFADATVITTCSFISPYRADRDQVRAKLPEGVFVEVFVDTPIEVCEARDPKGLYEKARQGLIPNFTGISAPYEAPEAPEIRLETGEHSVDACAEQVIAYLVRHGFFKES